MSVDYRIFSRDKVIIEVDSHANLVVREPLEQRSEHQAFSECVKITSADIDNMILQLNYLKSRLFDGHCGEPVQGFLEAQDEHTGAWYALERPKGA